MNGDILYASPAEGYTFRFEPRMRNLLIWELWGLISHGGGDDEELRLAARLLRKLRRSEEVRLNPDEVIFLISLAETPFFASQLYGDLVIHSPTGPVIAEEEFYQGTAEEPAYWTPPGFEVRVEEIPPALPPGEEEEEEEEES